MVFGLSKKPSSILSAADQARSSMVRVGLSPGQQGRDRCDVIGDIFFGTNVLKTQLGTVRLKLTGGYLHFTPENGRIPPGDIPRDLTPALNVTRDVAVKTVRGAETECKTTDSVAMGASVGTKSALTAKATSSHQDKVARSGRVENSYKTSMATLSAMPHGQHGMKIEFEPLLGELGTPQGLRGRVYDERLFSLIRTGEGSAGVEVTFQPAPGRVEVVEGTGVWKKGPPEKNKLIARLTAKLIDGEEWPLGRTEFFPEEEEMCGEAPDNEK